MLKLAILLASCLSPISYAGLIALTNSDLQKVEGQAGADISLKLSLNHTTDYKLDENICGNSTSNDIRNCRVGIAFNNRYDLNGRKQWLVLKGIQGTIILPRMGLDGVDLKYINDSGVEVVKPAIQLAISKSQPIQIRNLGFNALSIETDSSTPTDPNNVMGYWALKNGGTSTPTYNNLYANGRYTGAGYDQGREVGFTSLMMNGNLSLNSKLLIFSCDGTHPRC